MVRIGNVSVLCTCNLSYFLLTRFSRHLSPTLYNKILFKKNEKLGLFWSGQQQISKLQNFSNENLLFFCHFYPNFSSFPLISLLAFSSEHLPRYDRVEIFKFQTLTQPNGNAHASLHRRSYYICQSTCIL